MRNTRWVAKQHGHRITTMLTVYAAWVEGARECDIASIRRAMGYERGGPPNRSPTSCTAVLPPTPQNSRADAVPRHFFTGAGTEFNRLTIRVSVDTSALDIADWKEKRRRGAI